ALRHSGNSVVFKGSFDFNRSQFNRGNVTINAKTINILKLLNKVSITVTVPISFSRKWPFVATRSGAEADSPPCHSKKPLYEAATSKRKLTDVTLLAT